MQDIESAANMRGRNEKLTKKTVLEREIKRILEENKVYLARVELNLKRIKKLQEDLKNAQ